jgi:hypothetical protein
MKYAYPLTVVGDIRRDDTGMHTFPVWNNFVQYVKAKHGLLGDLFKAQLIIDSELQEWNACNNEGCDTISFKTPHDLTYFLLRFS